MHNHSPEFERQVIQIASLGVWQVITGKSMKRRLDPVDDHRWEGKNGLFITLKKNGETRGSMGMLESTTTLQESLFDTGSAAATHDSRFSPVEEAEIPGLEIEVTLLSEIKKMNNISEILIGVTGLIISRGEKRAVLLPQVALEHKWSAEQFLEACCEKAELSHKAWNDPNTLVEIFTSLIIEGGSLLKNIEELI